MAGDDERAGSQMDALREDAAVATSDAQKEAIEELSKVMAERKAAETARERELAAVAVAPEALALVQSECDLEKAPALHLLREHGGDARAALRAVARGEAALPLASA
uniref:Nascent polypeptide-associated complex subunit alpha-like UBA domain-containing protein n=1 Tax=Bicosoecida sp. CB-2014 TaxID=1486930 RepID=A0A7S1CBU2_9STRA|mmetsp:Transcript_18789/g.66380  ORF Transcript_18789/g.66380 Transcript_18789/m.66380 type:complete len:107 (+) Transcript_18789:173-493(+)